MPAVESAVHSRTIRKDGPLPETILPLPSAGKPTGQGPGGVLAYDPRK